MTKKIEFSAEQRNQIKLALQDCLQIANGETKDHFVDEIETSGTLRAFGFGSLLSYSHLQEPDKKLKDNLLEMFPGLDNEIVKTAPAVLDGYQRDFVCFDIVYRGTPDKPGITLGLDKSPEGKTNGGILETRIDGMDPNVAANFIEYYLKKFAEREMPPNMPIYTFDFINVTAKDGTTTPALVCIADPNGPLYVHNSKNRFAADPAYVIGRDDDGYAKKIHIMATALNPLKPNGDPKTNGAITDLDYLRNLIDDSMAKGIPVESRFHRLYADAVHHRMGVGREFRDEMKAFERTGKSANTPDLLGDFIVAIGAHNEKMAAPPENKMAPAP